MNEKESTHKRNQRDHECEIGTAGLICNIAIDYTRLKTLTVCALTFCHRHDAFCAIWDDVVVLR